MTLHKKLFLISFFFCAVFGVFAQNNDSLNSNSISSETVVQNDSNLSWSDLDVSSSSNVQQTTRARNNSAASVWIFFKMIFGLAVVIFLIWIVLKFMKRSVNPHVVEDDTFLRKISGISVGGANTVQLVTLMDKGYVLGVSEDRITVIDSISDKELIEAMNVYADRNAQVAKPKNFDDILELFISNGKFARKNKNVESKKTAFSSAEELLNSLKTKNEAEKNEE